MGNISSNKNEELIDDNSNINHIQNNQQNKKIKLNKDSMISI